MRRKPNSHGGYKPKRLEPMPLLNFNNNDNIYNNIESIPREVKIPALLNVPDYFPGNVASPYNFPGNVASPYNFPGNVASPYNFPGNVATPYNFPGIVASPYDIAPLRSYNAPPIKNSFFNENDPTEFNENDPTEFTFGGKRKRTRRHRKKSLKRRKIYSKHKGRSNMKKRK
jgi:hypothetical protein